MKLINEKIKELYGTDKQFCEAFEIDSTNFPRTKKKHLKWIDEMNEIYGKLGLEIQIAPLAQTGQKENEPKPNEPPVNQQEYWI